MSHEATAEPESLEYPFTQSHGEYARAWLREYYRTPRWGLIRGLGGPALVLVGLELRRLRPGEWLAALGSFTFGFGLYYALRPLVQVALLIVRRHRLRAHTRPTVVTVDDDGIGVRSGDAESRIGWAEIARAGVGADELWVEVRGAHRAILPLPSGAAERELLRRILRARGHG